MNYQTLDTPIIMDYPKSFVNTYKRLQVQKVQQVPQWRSTN